MSESGPILSIITVVYNGEEFIERTIKSVAAQSFKKYEYLIIDGASKDNTLKIIEKYSNVVSKFISEPDKGIYDAMNKGLSMASSEYVLFLNAGDTLHSESTLSSILWDKNADVYYGRTYLVNDKGCVLGESRLIPPKNLSWKKLKLGMLVCHQSFIVRKEVATNYDLKYKIVSDYDWMIRCLKASGNIFNTELFISDFLEGGFSRQNERKAWKERFVVMKKYYGVLITILCHVIIVFRFFYIKVKKKKRTGSLKEVMEEKKENYFP